MKKFILTLLWLAVSAGISFANTQPSAQNVTVNTSTFTKNLNNTDTTVQKALNTLDQVAGGGAAASPNTSFQYNNGGVFAGGNMYQVNGNVGVGSTAPTTQLDVAGAVRMQGFALPVGSSLAGKILTADANGNGTWQTNAATGGGVNPGNAGDFPYYASTGSFVSDQNILTINGANIGIGVSGAPSSTLQVNGTVTASGFVGAGAISGLTSSYIPLSLTSQTLGNSVINQVSGNVGIGSSIPSDLLDVEGTIRATNMVDTGVTSSSLVKTNGSQQLTAATPGTDYAPATSGTSILKGNGSGGFANAIGGTDYQTPLTFSTGLTNSAGTVVVNNSQNIAQLSNLTSNGLVTTSGSNGTLSITPFNGTLGLWETNSVGIDTFAPYVGIGSTNPGQALDVNGTIRGLNVTTTGTGNSTFMNQNVGIGSLTPGATLDVQGTVRDLSEILTSNVPGTTTNTLYNNSGTLYFNGSVVGAGTTFWTTTNTNDVYEVNSGTYGNVGVGTSGTSSNRLTVSGGNVSIGTVAAALNTLVVGGTGGGNVSIGTSAGAPTNGLVVLGNIDIGTGTTSSNLLTIYNPSNTNVSIGTTGTANNALSVSGAVSIGTTAAASTNGLQVLGNVSIGTGTTSSNALTIYNPSNTNVSIGTTAAAGELLSIQNGNVGIGTASAGAPIVVTGSGTISATFSGNVGIGTATPTAAITPTSILTIGGKCLGLSGDLYLNASGQVAVCTAGSFPACSSSTTC